MFICDHFDLISMQIESMGHLQLTIICDHRSDFLILSTIHMPWVLQMVKDFCNISHIRWKLYLFLLFLFRVWENFHSSIVSFTANIEIFQVGKMLMEDLGKQVLPLFKRELCENRERVWKSYGNCLNDSYTNDYQTIVKES